MNRSLRHLATLVACIALIAGCGKKEADTEVAEEAEAALPSTEQVSPTTAQISDHEALAEAVSAPAASEGTAGNAEFEAWFKKHNLDLNDSGMLDADPDGDGASNRDEFLADSNPNDGASRPGIHKSIRLTEYQEVRLPIVVESVEGGTARIRRTDVEGKVETVKAGDTLRGLPIKVSRVEKVQETDKSGTPIDRSFVAVEDSGTKERMMLVKDMPARAGSHAMLTSADGTKLKVKQGDTFKWPGDDTATYKVIDLREDQVVLQQVENKKMWTVTRKDAAPTAPPAQ
ncbi:MAG: hypothetical protein JWQ44_1477 [Chthoniobacter sp.]|jgi:hypothetical protein|nr:hypothetical protein [Chthoniobacter sp.]